MYSTLIHFLIINLINALAFSTSFFAQCLFVSLLFYFSINCYAFSTPLLNLECVDVPVFNSKPASRFSNVIIIKTMSNIKSIFYT